MFRAIAIFWVLWAVGLAQGSEQKPAPGLDDGVLLDIDGSLLRGEPASPRLSKPIGTGDFSICVQVETLDLQDAILFSHYNWGAGWYMTMAANGAVKFEARMNRAHFAAPEGSLKGHAKHFILVSVKRNASKPESSMWIDGVQVATGAIPPVEEIPINFLCEMGKVKSLHVRLYDRALIRREILELSGKRAHGP
jgi:hypothetical protein